MRAQPPKPMAAAQVGEMSLIVARQLLMDETAAASFPDEQMVAISMQVVPMVRACLSNIEHEP